MLKEESRIQKNNGDKYFEKLLSLVSRDMERVEAYEIEVFIV